MRLLVYAHFFQHIVKSFFSNFYVSWFITNKAKITFQGILVSFPLCPHQPSFSLAEPEDHHEGWCWRRDTGEGS